MEFNNLIKKPKMFDMPSETDFLAFDYESPIKVLETQMRMEFEDNVVRAVKSVGIDVDKDELVRALQYDRDQYVKGYKDGKASNMVVGEWVDRYGDKYANHLYECSECHNTALYTVQRDCLGHEQIIQELSNWCPHCGVRMNWGEEE